MLILYEPPLLGSPVAQFWYLIGVLKGIKENVSFKAPTIFDSIQHLGPVYMEVGDPRSCKRDQGKMRNYINRRVPSPTQGLPLQCKQALTSSSKNVFPQADLGSIITTDFIYDTCHLSSLKD